MFQKKQIWLGIITLVLLFGVTNIAIAQKSEKYSESTDIFLRIEQPKAIKLGVTLGGLALISAELWWFLFSKTKAQKAHQLGKIQEINIMVDRGYVPERIIVKAGQPVRMNFFRKDSSTCLDKVLLPDFHQAADLSLNKTTSVEFIPESIGNYTFHCGMNMFRGVIEVRDEIEKDVTELREIMTNKTSS